MEEASWHCLMILAKKKADDNIRLRAGNSRRLGASYDESFVLPWQKDSPPFPRGSSDYLPLVCVLTLMVPLAVDSLISGPPSPRCTR